MYEYLKGEITKITPNYIVCEVAGIGYLLNVANPYTWSARLNTVTQVYVYQVVREDAQTLFGFISADEKAIFLKLIGVTGIGPKSALAIIARDDNDGLVAAIDKNDIAYLIKFPGVGKKTASQMILDLAGKFNPQTAVTIPTVSGNAELDEALEALEALGYRSAELKKIEKKLIQENKQTTEDYIKLALKLLVR